MQPKPATRRPILVLFLIGILLFMATASAPALGAPPEPEPDLERDVFSPFFTQPRLSETLIAAYGIERSLGTEVISSPEVGEGWSLSVYESLRTGNWDIFLADGTYGSETQLTRRSDNEGSPKLDPGANRIVYVSDRDDGTQIWTMNRDGSDARRLTGGEDSLNPTWSPNGTRIAYDQNTPDGGSEIFVMNADGSGQTRLTYSPELDAMPTWSPDGNRLAFISARSGGYRVWVMNADGSNQTQLNNIPYSLYPAWSPNGAMIAFSVANSSSFLDVWVMNADGSNPHEVFITNNHFDNYVSGWSPNSRLILFTKVELIYWDGDWYWVSTDIGSVAAERVSWTDFTSYYRTGLEMNQQWISLDHQPPASSLTPPSEVIPSPYTFKITATDTGGSGIAYYSLQLRDHADGIWQDVYTEAKHDFVYFPQVLTQGGHTYDVRVRSEDHAGNLEPWPATPNATVRTESYPPLIRFTDPQRYVQGTEVALEWAAQEVGGSNLDSMSLYYRELGDPDWIPRVENTQLFTETVGLNQGATFEFMLRAKDSAGNISPEVTSGPAYQIITSYSKRLDGVAHDFTGVPRPGVQVSMSDNELAGVEANAADGSFSAYSRGWMPDFSAGFSLPLYGSLPATYHKNLEDPVHLYLPPADNLLSNSHFEQALSAPESAWQTGGSLPVVLSEGMLHSGAASVALGDPASYFTSPAPLVSADSTGYEPSLMQAGEDGSLHFAWSNPEDGRVYYLRKPAGGDWGAIELALSVSQRWPEYMEMVVGADGAAHLFVIDEGVALYTRRPATGVWSAPRTISDGRGAVMPWDGTEIMTVDGLNRVHVIWQCQTTSELCYSMGNPAGSWTAVETLLSLDLRPQAARTVATSQGDFYAFLAGVSYSNIYNPFIHRSPAGEWEIYETDVSPYANGHLLMLDANETPVLITFRNSSRQYFMIQTRWYTGNGVWSPEQEHTQEPGFEKLAVYLDSANTLHMVWDGATEDLELSLHYSRFQRNGTWQDSILPLNNTPIFEVIFDATGTAHLILSGDQFWYTQARNGNLLHSPILLPDYAGGYDTYSILIDAQNNPQFFQNYFVPETSQGFQHLQIAQASAAGEASLAQEVSLPAGMEHPTLSLMYKLSGGEAQGDSKLSIWIDSIAGQSQLWSRSSPGFNWEHAWVDLTAWAGETVTVTARLEQAAGERILLANLDEVTLGSGYPDGWLSVLPADRKVPTGEAFALEIAYGNQGGFALPGGVIEVNLPAGLELLDPLASCAGGPPVYSCSLGAPGELAAGAQGALTLSLRSTPAAPFNQRLELGLRLATTGTELELLNNQLSVGIIPVNELYLPSIGNWWAGE